MLLLLPLFASLGMAQRPNGASLCDYYAEARYGSNSSTTQLQLIEGIVAMAFGGNKATKNASSSLTGILNPGAFNDLTVNLHPYFDGTLSSTNLNNQPVGINWLDGGGLDPLYSYLNGSASSVSFENNTNQNRLFTHFFADFADQFGCSHPPPSPPSTTGQSGKPNLAYTHKFMNLNQTDLLHFINQLTLAVQYFGFSDEDAQTLNATLNAKHNIRCAPPDNGELDSLCQASSCPLAVPNSDCAAYNNLTAEVIVSADPSGAAATEAPTPFTPSAVAPLSTIVPTDIDAITATPTSTSAPVSDSSSSSLTPGAIAGIAIGGAVVVLLAVVVALVWRYKNKKHRAARAPPPAPAGLGFMQPPMDQEPHTPYYYQPSTPTATHVSTASPPPPSWKGAFSEPPASPWKGPINEPTPVEGPLSELDGGDGPRREMGDWR